MAGIDGWLRINGPFTRFTAGAQHSYKYTSHEWFVKVGVGLWVEDVWCEYFVHDFVAQTCTAANAISVVASGALQLRDARRYFPGLEPTGAPTTPCFVMVTPRIAGVTLAAALDAAAANPARQDALLVGAFVAIAKLHAAKVVHQDAKFDNLLVETGTNDIKAVDYQLAVVSGRVNNGCTGFSEPYEFAVDWTPELYRSDVFTLVKSAQPHFKTRSWWPAFQDATIGSARGVSKLYIHPGCQGWSQIASCSDAVAYLRNVCELS